MRLALVAVSAALAFAAAAMSAGATTEARPTLRVTATSPLELRGLYFKRRERVRVVVTYQGSTYTRLTRASTRGAFTVTFARLVGVDPCDLEARGIGSAGSRARVALSERVCLVP